MSKKALVIEDDPQLVELLVEPLSELGYELIHASDGEAGLAEFSKSQAQLIILDLSLPDMEGAEICRKIRETDSQIPIVVLSGTTDELNTALLLELGADDYVNKPFRRLELKARIKVLQRRQKQQEVTADVLDFGSIVIDPAERKVSVEGTEVELTAREFDLLCVLAQSPGRPFTRDELNQSLFGYDSGIYDHSISCHVNRIRKKLEKDSRNPQYIKTKRGYGYYFPKD